MINAILFDLDGVIIDFCDNHFEALNLALLDHGYNPISYQEHINVFNALTTKNKLDILLKEDKIRKESLEDISNSKQEHTSVMINNVKKDWNKIKIFQKLYQDGYKIGCVTNSIRKTCESILSRLGIIEYFNILVCNEDVKFNKPYPDPYKKACLELKVNPRNVLCIEDSDKGVKSALNAVCRVLKVNNSKNVTYNLITSRISEINQAYREQHESNSSISAYIFNSRNT